MKGCLKKKPITKTILFHILILLAILTIVVGTVLYRIWNSRYTKTDDSFFNSSFVQKRKVMVIVPHQDDEINLAYGVIDSFVEAGSDVFIVFSTNGDSEVSAATRVSEAVLSCTRMGVPKENIILLGYGDHQVPPFYLSDLDLVLESEAGYVKTYGAEEIKDYHSVWDIEPAAYTRDNFQKDIYHLIMDIKPDVIFATDADYNIDHVSLSQVFDRVMGSLLRENMEYRPVVLKGFCYEYAWHGNEDFYHSLTLSSAVPSWITASYFPCYSWAERVRFPLPNEYLSYTLRSSKLRNLLLAYESQNAISHQNSLQNSDRVFWERRTDTLWASITASSGDASLLQDFLISDTLEDPLGNCWIPDDSDIHPQIHFSWAEPQNIYELVFYDAPAPAGDITRVVIEDDNGKTTVLLLPNGSGEPYHCILQGQSIQNLTISILESEGSIIGLSEIEILPMRDQKTQWIHIMDQNSIFLYEFSYPENQEFDLLLYGYPATPVNATLRITKISNGVTLHELRLDGYAFHIPKLGKGCYLVRVDSGDCYTEVVLRIGDSMLSERLLRFVERKYDDLFYR